MKLINIYPLANSYLYRDQEMNMFLTHLIEKDYTYLDIAKKSKGYKILDNSLIEVGESMSIERVLAAAEKIGADEIVLPDVFMDGEKTVEIIKDTLEKYKDQLKDYKLQAVVHGKDPLEWLETFHILNNMEEIDVLGIPKVLTNQFRDLSDIDSRAFLLNTMIEASNKEIHLLGLWENIGEFKEHKNLKLIRSCDTSLFALYDLSGVHINFVRGGEKIDLEHDKMIDRIRCQEAVEYVRRIVENV